MLRSHKTHIYSKHWGTHHHIPRPYSQYARTNCRNVNNIIMASSLLLATRKTTARQVLALVYYKRILLRELRRTWMHHRCPRTANAAWPTYLYCGSLRPLRPAHPRILYIVAHNIK